MRKLFQTSRTYKVVTQVTKNITRRHLQILFDRKKNHCNQFYHLVYDYYLFNSRHKIESMMYEAFFYSNIITGKP